MDGWQPTARKKVAPKRPTPTQLLQESLDHLDKLVSLHVEWQTDWAAIQPETEGGETNPDFDPSYVQRLRQHPEEVYDPAVLAARDFLKKLRPS